MTRAAAPYLALLALILLTRLVPAVREPMREIAWEWRLAERFSGRFEPLYYPGTLLFIGFVIGGLLQGRSAGEILGAAARAGTRLVPVAMALAAMLGLARVMVHGGMTAALAEAAAASGAVWPFLSPFLGVLGTFVTGSATSSNILFSEFQKAAATALSLPVATL
jgi:lactate permease